MATICHSPYHYDTPTRINNYFQSNAIKSTNLNHIEPEKNRASTKNKVNQQQNTITQTAEPSTNSNVTQKNEIIKMEQLDKINSKFHKWNTVTITNL